MAARKGLKTQDNVAPECFSRGPRFIFANGVPAFAGTTGTSRFQSFARLLLIFLLLIAGAAHADDANLDRRVMKLASQLRCLVCQNETLADSQAPLAADLRNQIREQLAAGKSERQVVDFLVARYGDFVLYRPPLKGTTVLLWTGPFLFLAFGAFLLVRFVRARRGFEPRLSEEDRARAAKLLE